MKSISSKEMLKTDSIESLLYLATMKQKTQTEAIELMYNKKNINSEPIKKARVKMAKDGVLDIIQEVGVMRNFPLRARIDPFLEYLLEKSKARISMKPGEHTLNESDIKYLKLVLDSDYFRGIYFNQHFIDIGKGIHRHTIYRDLKGRLHVAAGAFNYMELVLESVIIHSLLLWHDLQDMYVQDTTDISMKYCDSNNYLKWALNRSNDNLKERLNENKKLKAALNYTLYDKDPGTRYYFDKIVFSGFFLLFPKDLVLKLQAISHSGGLLSFVVAYDAPLITCSTEN